MLILNLPPRAFAREQRQSEVEDALYSKEEQLDAVQGEMSEWRIVCC